MKIDHIHFYVDHAEKWRDWFVEVMGFASIAHSQTALTRTEVVGAGLRSPITFLLSSPLHPQSPVAQYLRHHPPGVADVAMQVTDCSQVWQESLQAGAKGISSLRYWDFIHGSMEWGTLQTGWGITHSLIERHGTTPWLPDRPWHIQSSSPSLPWLDIDHVVLNLAVADFKTAIAWYEQVWGFAGQQQFAIATEKSGLYSQVLIHPHSGLQLPINAPKGDRSQIQAFLALNRGAGVQHIALAVANIVERVHQLRNRSLSFLNVPSSYYAGMQPSIYGALTSQERQAIQRLQILVDREECFPPSTPTVQDVPLLLQIFSQPIFAEPTFFFECIERRSQARGFGEGNFQALFEAIERQQYPDQGGYSLLPPW
jgi:4-hydroxyphenylpyruvate dioxygenase